MNKLRKSIAWLQEIFQNLESDINKNSEQIEREISRHGKSWF